MAIPNPGVFSSSILAGSIVAQVILRPVRKIAGSSFGDVIAQAVIEERHNDRLHITDHPVENGVVISDHAFRQPAHLSLIYAWAAGSLEAFESQANSVKGTESANFLSGDPDFLRGLYEKLRAMQAERALLEVFTGKRLYQNMLIESLSHTTTKETEHALVVTVGLREVIVVTTVDQPLQSQNLASPEANGPTIPQGTVSTIPATSTLDLNPA